jgi:hypothetical protein
VTTSSAPAAICEDYPFQRVDLALGSRLSWEEIQRYSRPASVESPAQKQNAPPLQNGKRPDLPGVTTSGNCLLNEQVTRTGFEHASDSTGEQQAPLQGGAFSGALSGEIAPELAEVARAWSALPATVRAKILAMVRVIKQWPTLRQACPPNHDTGSASVSP